MNLFGFMEEGGMESKKVVDVPSERMASPGADRDITVAGLSPVKEAIIQSDQPWCQHTAAANLRGR